MLPFPRCSPSLALLALLLRAAGTAGQPCEAEMNKIKDLLQLDCVGKGLCSLPSDLPRDTGILLLASNCLARVSLDAFSPLHNLTELDLSNNSLGALETGAHLPTLQQLILSHNTLQSLPDLQGLPGLRRLALGHNAIRELPEGGLRALGGLQELELQGNQLRVLPARAFEGLVELKDLDLSDNLLESLPWDLLDGLVMLEILRLERNRLRRLPSGFFPDDALFAYIYLAGNPWVCNCQLRYLRDWLRENEHSIYTRTTVHQQGPGKLTKEITEHDPPSVVCQGPRQQKGIPVILFEAVCRNLGDGDGLGGDETDSEAPEASSPPAFASALLVPSTAPAFLSTRPAIRFAAFAMPTLTTSAATTPPGPSTAVPTTLAAKTTAAPPGPSTAVPTTLAAETTAAPPGPSTAVPTREAHVIAATHISERFPFPTTRSLWATLLPTRRLGAPWSPTAVGTAAPVPETTSPIDTPCLCPRHLVRLEPSVQAASPISRQRTPSTWAALLVAHCCLLHLILYGASSCLVVLTTLVLLCYLGWMHATWYRPALQGYSGARLSRYQKLQVVVPTGQRTESTKAPQPLTPASTYRVCKTLPVGHVTWLFISLPSPGRRWPGQGSSSPLSLDRAPRAFGGLQQKSMTSTL